MPLDQTTFCPEVVTDLRAGRAYIEVNGWCQNQSRSDLQVCAFGGIFAVTGGQFSSGITGADVRRQRACDALQAALDARLGRFVSVARWQDDPERTVDDVFSLYDFAIEREGLGQ